MVCYIVFTGDISEIGKIFWAESEHFRDVPEMIIIFLLGKCNRVKSMLFSEVMAFSGLSCSFSCHVSYISYPE